MSKKRNEAERKKAERTPTDRPLTNREEVLRLRDAGALFVVSHSGGKDSQAMYLELRDLIPREQILVVYAKLTGDMVWTENVDHIRATTDDAELMIARARHKGGAVKSFWSRLEHRSESLRSRGKGHVPPWPGMTRTTRWCTPDLKRDPIVRDVRAYMDAHGFRTAVMCLGIRALESDLRAKDPDWQVLTKLATAGRAAFTWHPIKGWSARDVFDKIDEAGQQPHPIYAKGMRRNSCCFCIYLNPDDMQVAAKLRPALFERYVETEKALGFTLKPKATMEEYAGITVAEAKAANRRIRDGLETAGVPVDRDNPIGDGSLAHEEPCDDWTDKPKKKIIVIDRT